MQLTTYRAELRQWLRSPHPVLDELRGTYADTHEEQCLRGGPLQAALYEAGWNRWGWPEEVGGLGGDAMLRGVLYDELFQAGLSVPETCLSLEVLAPALVHYHPELARRVLPANLRGEQIWGQGFSEPDAGSDMASMRCRGVLDGDHYVVNGQKTWMSNGHVSRWALVLVRTGTTESRSRGITALWVDLEAPGVTVRPLKFASGMNELAEVFFTDVRVPVEDRVGEPNQGWSVAMYLLQFERGMYAWQRQAWMLARLRDLAPRVNPGPAADRLLGEVYLAVLSLRSRTAQTLARLAADETPGPEVSVDKLLLGRAEQVLLDAARELLSPELELSGEPWARQWRDAWFYTRAATIYGGSAELQRGIIADHVLKLPTEKR